MHLRHGVLAAVFVACRALSTAAPFSPNIHAEGVPEPTEELRRRVGPYLEFRTAQLQDWHPRNRGALVITRFGNLPQLHLVRLPGGDRRQLTFRDEPISSGRFQPESGRSLVFSEDSGGGEFYQLLRQNLGDGGVALLTDGRSRNTGPRWSPSGRWLAYASTRRNGRDSDIRIVDPARPESDRLASERNGGGWSVLDWSPDEKRLLLQLFTSVERIDLFTMEVGTGAVRPVSPEGAGRAVFAGGQFIPGENAAVTSTDRDGEFRQLAKIDLETGRVMPLGERIMADVEDFEISADGRRVAWVSNEDGISVLRVLDLRTGRTKVLEKLGPGVITGLRWRPGGREVGLTLNSARSPSDVFAVDVRTHSITRWTESETGGVEASRLAEPELVRVRSFDGLALSGILFRPNAKRFPGPRPVLISIHGGPEAQSRPIYQGRWNYLIEEMGVAILYPNVRGSTGYGKKFLALDNGLRREDAVKDIGAFIDWVGGDSRLDGGRVGLYGGSYGGFMVLASLARFGDRVRCGVDVVGITSFPSFLKSTQEYRRDLRRAEYGDEREPQMAEFLERISPLANADRIGRPVFIVQGRNDPRVAASESEQIVRALRARGGTAWYMVAQDEGHGFAKKANADLMFLSLVRFLEEYLMR